MKVLIITEKSDRSEVAIFKGLIEAGIELHVISGLDSVELSTLKVNGMRASELHIRHRLDFRSIKMIKVYLQAHPVDIIYAPTNKALSCALLATRGTEIKVVGYRGTSGHISRFDPASWLAYLNPGLDKIFCVSESVRQYLLSVKIPEKRLVTIHKGHNIEWYNFGAPPSLTEFGIPKNAFVVCFAGNMRPVKGVDILLRAIAQLKNDSVHFLMLGEVRDKRIKEMAQDPLIAARTHFTGFRKDAAELIGACDAFVMPSIEREGLPRAVIEAMAQGIPPIVTKVGGLPELIDADRSGLIVPPKNPQALAEAIEKLASNPALCATIGAQAQQKISTDFDINKTIEKIIEEFKKLLTD